jgi:hypothetical protein
MKTLADAYEINIKWFYGVAIGVIAAMFAASTGNMTLALFEVLITIIIAIIGNHVYKENIKKLKKYQGKV